MAFDRHEILKRHYYDEISQWDWNHIIARLYENSEDENCYDEQDGQRHVHLWLGSVYALTPSGKVYTFWTSNQTRADETRDAAWYEALEEVCESYGCYITYPEGAAGDDIFIGKSFDVEEEE